MKLNRYAAGIEYFGKNYKGWQTQKSTSETIQFKIDGALSKIADSEIKSICAGRTDSGVNALSQVIHFESDKKRSLKAWMEGCNSVLPDDIRFIWIKKVPETFHARFSAIKRTYKYFVLNAQNTSVFYKNKTVHIKDKIDIEIMRDSSKYLIGEKDFTSFRSTGCQSKSPMREIYEINISKRKNLICFEISANAFLLNMVRIIVGTLLEFGIEEKSPLLMKTIVDGRDRNLSGKTISAYGLYFIGPEYPSEFKINKPPLKYQILPT